LAAPGVAADFPEAYPGPLLVGQRVTARHPKTRQIHDGQVLTVDADKARVQFHSMELGSELLKDTDVMPVRGCPPTRAALCPKATGQGMTAGRKRDLSHLRYLFLMHSA